VAEIPVVNVEPLRAQLDEFVRVLRTGDQPYVDGLDGVWAVAIANAMLASAVNHRPVDLTDLPARLGAAGLEARRPQNRGRKAPGQETLGQASR
jgi:hypothetical protein